VAKRYKKEQKAGSGFYPAQDYADYTDYPDFFFVIL
jgi:hypothetical protein